MGASPHTLRCPGCVRKQHFDRDGFRIGPTATNLTHLATEIRLTMPRTRRTRGAGVVYAAIVQCNECDRVFRSVHNRFATPARDRGA